jgi:glutathione S-transferase
VQPTLFQGDGATAVTRFVNSWADTQLLPAIARIILIEVYRCLDTEDQTYFRASREKHFGMELEQVVADQPARLADLRKALQPLRHMLRKQDFISGRVAAYADYCVFGMFMWARRCSAVELLEVDDVVTAWRGRLLNEFGGLARSAPTRF